MKNWRNKLLTYFAEPVPTLTIAADPDGLLSDETIGQALRAREIVVVSYGDPVVFRYEYESRLRDALDGASLRLVVAVAQVSLQQVPFDILSRGTSLEVSRARMFPRLSPRVLKGLSLAELDAVAAVYEEYGGGPAESDTMRFVLQAMYDIDVNRVYSHAGVLELLLRVHDRGCRLSAMLADCLAEQLAAQPGSVGMPVREFVCSEQAYFSYLQGEWSAYIAALQQQSQTMREMPDGMTAVEAQYPLADKRVRVLLEDLFACGKLQPAHVAHRDGLPDWIRLGVAYDAGAQARIRIMEEIFRLSETLHAGMTYRDWMQAAMRYGSIKAGALKVGDGSDSEVNANFQQLQRQVDRLFSEWALTHYNQLVNMPYLPHPVMVHHIPHYLASRRQGGKLALIVMDGMSIVEWQQIREVLQADFTCHERAVFAWIPTITAVSRQAIFCGERPAYYAASITTTGKEDHHWQTFWERQGIVKQYVEYRRVADYPASFEPYASHKPSNKVKAIVVDWIDQLVHAALQENRGLYEEVAIWLETGFLQAMIGSLLTDGYQIYLTADHGNRECSGVGRLGDGVLAHTRGERVRVYSNKLLRDQAAAKYSSIIWDSPSLPPDMQVLLSPVDGAFIAKEERIISHGSIAVEEVIVPFVTITAKERDGLNYYG